MQSSHPWLSHPCPKICPKGRRVRDVTGSIEGASRPMTP